MTRILRYYCLFFCLSAPLLHSTEAEDITKILDELKDGTDDSPGLCHRGIDRMRVSYENELAAGISLSAETLASPHTTFSFPVNVAIDADAMTVTYQYTDLQIEWGEQHPTQSNPETARYDFYAQIAPFLAFYTSVKYDDAEPADTITLPFPIAGGALRASVNVDVFRESRKKRKAGRGKSTITFASQVHGQSQYVKEYNTGQHAQVTLYCTNLNLVHLLAIPPKITLSPSEELLRLAFPQSAIYFREKP